MPVERANITVTSISGNVSRTARTDKAGRFTVTFPGDEGDYYVNIAALGFATKRFEVKRTGDQEILVADARLQRVATQLDAVKVNAERQKVGRNDNSMDVSGTERMANSGAVSADQLGDLAALAASIPGVQLIPNADGTNGFSVLGLTPDQNATTLNGMNFGGSNLPRDANVSTSLVTTPYDVSRGNFSGGLLNVSTRRASNFIVRSTSLNFDAPQTQWADRAAQSLGQRYYNVSAGGALLGPIQADKSFFNMAWQAGRRQSDLQSLLNTSPLGLQTVGVSVDSVNRLLNIIGRWRLPTGSSGMPGNRLQDQALVFGSLDFLPPGSTTGSAYNVTFTGGLNRQDPATPLTTELPSHSGERTSWNASVQGKHSNYFGFGVLSETSLGFNAVRSYATPFALLPSGTVRVNSTFDDGTPGVQTVSFGGNPGMNTSVTTTTAQAMNAMSWFSENNKHRLKLTSELRRDNYAQDLSSNQLGSFTYNSLGDLEAGRPAAFTRQLSQRKRSESAYIGGLSLGDSYRPTQDFQLQYGVRVDGNEFASTPAYNADVDRAFGVRNDHVPNNYYVSPRVGFSWMYGTASQIGGFDGAVRGPRAVIRGGMGVFQSTPNAASIGSAMDNTGLPSAVQQLTCVGSAAPTPDWTAYMNNIGSVPTQCADGTLGSVFSNTAPNVVLFAKDYVSPRSLRSNLNWSGSMLGDRLMTRVDATYSRNLNQTSTFDLNFNPAARFGLPDEGRLVYAQPSDIVASTGAIPAGEGRSSSSFSHVSELRSDLESETKQLTLSVSPMSFNTTFTWGLSYVYSQAREQYRGFSSTVADPRDVAWGRSSFDSRHQLQYRFTYNAFDFIRLGWFGSFRSGLPYTPMVANDVNGDGYLNDRAFIYDPAKTADPTLASAMQALLQNASGSARDCLTSQLGALAGRNSCQGPWTASANLTFSFNPLKVRMPQRTNLTFQLSNPLYAADLLFHGESNLHGWGQSAIPQNQLFYVRGFDAATKRYKYEVNPRFGSTALAQTAVRDPVRLTAMLRVDVGPTRERQQLTQLLDRGRTLSGVKAPEALIKGMGSIGITNPMAMILRQADTLELTPQQADSIAVLNRNFSIKADSVWTPVAKFLAALPDRYDQGEAYDRYRLARETTLDALLRVAPLVKSLLTPTQFRKLPSYVSAFLDPRFIASVRSGTQGGGLGMIMGGPGMAVPAGAVGGGGGVQVIIRSGTP